MWTTSAEKVAAALIAAALLALPCHAQSLYRYRDVNGNWVFTDRQPPGGSHFEQIEVQRQSVPGEIRLYRRDLDGDAYLAVENSFHGVVQIAFRLVAAGNLSDDVPRQGNRILEPRSDTTLFQLTPAVAGEHVGAEYEYQYLHGDPRARHEPTQPYRLPYALANRFRISQAFPDQITHTDRANIHAIDFEMPVGTNVFAAREGIVLDVASDYFEAGVDPGLVSQANLVRILHDDGTIALYAHLNWNSIRVAPGQRVARGEYIADSGNTGFSSGPHLHFVVQRNIGGEIESVPIRFAAAGGESFDAATGDAPTAY